MSSQKCKYAEQQDRRGSSICLLETHVQVWCGRGSMLVYTKDVAC